MTSVELGERDVLSTIWVCLGLETLELSGTMSSFSTEDVSFIFFSDISSTAGVKHKQPFTFSSSVDTFDNRIKMISNKVHTKLMIDCIELYAASAIFQTCKALGIH